MANTDYDVMIVGAGFAGVTVSRELSNQGYNTLALEGRDRIGGRTWYDHRLGENLEMGGTFIHWFQPNIWSETMRYNLDVVKLPDIRNAYWISDGTVNPGKQDEEFEIMRQGMKVFAPDVETYFPRPYEPCWAGDAVREIDHLSIADRLEQIKADVSQETLDVLDAYGCAYFCTDDLTEPALTQAYR